MNAEKYLEQIAILDRRIKNKTRDMERWRESAEYSSTDYGAERVQSSGNKSRMENAIIRSLGLEEQIKKDVAKRNSIIADLDRLSETHIEPYSVLYGIYVLGQAYKDIAVEMDKSLSWVRDNRKIGLIEVEKILEERK